MSYLGALLSALLHLAIVLLLASGLLAPERLPLPEPEVPIEIVRIERVAAEAPKVEAAEPPPEPLAEVEPPPEELAELPPEPLPEPLEELAPPEREPEPLVEPGIESEPEPETELVEDAPEPLPEAEAEPESEIETVEAVPEADSATETELAATDPEAPLIDDPDAVAEPSLAPEVAEPEIAEAEIEQPELPAPALAETIELAQPSEPLAPPEPLAAPLVAGDETAETLPEEIVEVEPELPDPAEILAESEAQASPPVPAPKPPPPGLAEAALPMLGDPADPSMAQPEAAAVDPTVSQVATTEASNEALPDQPLDDLESLVALIQKQIRPCWKGAGVNEVLRVDVSLNPDGSIGSLEMPDWTQIASDDRLRTAANQAFDAIRACSPYRLPEDKYALWRALRFRMHADS